MSGKKIAIFGSKTALKQVHIKELKKSLDMLKHEVVLLPHPKILTSFTKWTELDFDWAIYIGEETRPPEDIKSWYEVFSQLVHQPLFAVWSFEPLSQNFRVMLKPDFEFEGADALNELVESLGLCRGTAIKSEYFLSDLDLNLVELSQKVSEDGDTGLHTGAFLEDPSSLSMMPVDSNGGFEVEHAGEEPMLSPSEDSQAVELHDSLVDEPSLSQSDSHVENENFESQKFDELDDLFAGEASNKKINEKLQDEESDPFLSDSESVEDSALSLAGVNDESEDLASGAFFEEDVVEEESVQASGGFSEEANFMDEVNNELGKSSENESLESSNELFASDDELGEKDSASVDPLGFGETDMQAAFEDDENGADPSSHTVFDAKEIQANKVASQDSTADSIDDLFGGTHAAAPGTGFEVNDGLSKVSGHDREDIKVIKRYAILKEREAREKSAALTALKNEFSKNQEKFERSEAERRRLALKAEDLDLQLRTATDSGDEHRHKFRKMEQNFQEQLKDLQIRLESSQFQASKSERKLEEFRDRVRNDIQRIRVRERELANRLELQKRDAEALLAVKDERLLQQKREIDRIQFEVESMRERLEEEVERSEDRSKKLGRAMQSLKLAQGMLSGLEDEQPSRDGSNDDGEAA